MDLRKKKYRYDKGQNYSLSTASYLDQIEEYYRERKTLHASHRTYLTSLLTSRGLPVPEGEREMLDAARGGMI